MTMTSDQVAATLEQIAKTTKRTEKEALLKHHKNDAGFRAVLYAAYNPFITYGIDKVPEVEANGLNETFNEWTWLILEMLAKRELTGNDARAEVTKELRRMSPASRRVLIGILQKDLNCGIAEATINKAIPGLIPTFGCMLAHKYDPKRLRGRWPVIVEPKLDGVRVLAIVNHGVRFLSRSGKEFTTFEHLKPYIERYVKDGWVLDGEVVSGSFNKTVSEVRRKDDQALDAVYHVFDMFPLHEFQRGCVEVSFVSRRGCVEMLAKDLPSDAPIRASVAYRVNNEEEINAIYANVRARGLEGLIVKDLSAFYECKRSYAWMKIKNEETLDLRVIGAFEGEGKYVGMLGGLIVDHNGVEVRIGGGFSDDQRKELWAAWQNDVNHPMYGKDPILWRPNLLGRIIEVEYHEVTPDGSLRHPRFVRFRDTLAPGVKE